MCMSVCVLFVCMCACLLVCACAVQDVYVYICECVCVCVGLSSLGGNTSRVNSLKGTAASLASDWGSGCTEAEASSRPIAAHSGVMGKQDRNGVKVEHFFVFVCCCCGPLCRMHF